MARRLEKGIAIRLRKQGKTYNEIIQKLKVPKGTLSGWLSDYPLTPEQLEKLSRNIKRRRMLSVEKIIAVKHKKRQEHLDNTYREQKEKLLPLTQRELLIAGLFLYWGEGGKAIKSSISLNNTDPKVVSFYHYWLIKVLGVPKDKIRVALHVYSDMNVDETINFWCKELGVSRGQFIKPYVKKSLRSGIVQKGFGHGTCGLYINNQRLKESIILGIKAISDLYSKRNSMLV